MDSLSIKVVTGVVAFALLGFGAATYAEAGPFERAKAHVGAGASSASQQGHSAAKRLKARGGHSAAKSLKARGGGRAKGGSYTCNASGDSPEHGECSIDLMELVCGGVGLSSEDGGGVTCTYDPH